MTSPLTFTAGDMTIHCIVEMSGAVLGLRQLLPGLSEEGQQYELALTEAGLRYEDIDYVFCTHLHVDHVGWNTRLIDGKWAPTFPKARYTSERKY
jgi:glyoxylase-like metal-dependent hydrolase (beta-lactamase superfamily II)